MPLVEYLLQIVYGLKLGITYCGRCLFDHRGKNVEGMHKYVLGREVWLGQVGVE